MSSPTRRTSASVPTAPGLSPGVRRVTLDASGVPLSALLAEPTGGLPRAAVVALHGGGMTAGYFDGQARPDLSLLTLGARLGLTVLAVDRPGYGASAPVFPDGQTLTEQSMTLRAALDDFAGRYETGGGLFLLAHSYGGKLALTAAADDDRGRLLGLDVSGCGHRYAVPEKDLPGADGRVRPQRSWGPPGLYPPGTFSLSQGLVAPMPAREVAELPRWPRVFPEVAARVRVPVRLTFAEYESLWRHDDEAVAGLRALLAAPRVVVDRLGAAGHNISLGLAARAYHLRALAFLEECLARRPEAATAPC
ncbi:alpha/beta hydrolase [Streptomyces deccanensis]|uniref:alpha/beta hydrolase n=1 Tax=Streptomyces deccanensis TaxID=424188 RepID=UPI001EFC0131|nr:alpha/beta fold hydrolase [Streptomyces deccanensis]ULR51533.1 alpha/beta fold hydrolase [Streptomyces deccanensis]